MLEKFDRFTHASYSLFNQFLGSNRGDLVIWKQLRRRFTSKGITSKTFTSKGFTSKGFTSKGFTSKGFTSKGVLIPDHLRIVKKDHKIW